MERTWKRIRRLLARGRNPPIVEAVQEHLHGLPRLLHGWQIQGLALPPEMPASVEETFGRCGVVPSQQVVQMYSMLGGMSDMDSQNWRLWSLEEVEKENCEPSP